MQGKSPWLGLQHRFSFSFRTQLGLAYGLALLFPDKCKQSKSF